MKYEDVKEFPIQDDWIPATEVALSHWWCGTKFQDEDIEEYGQVTIEEGMKAAQVLSDNETQTMRMLTMWIGYLEANQDEGDAPGTFEDFILATYITGTE